MKHLAPKLIINIKLHKLKSYRNPQPIQEGSTNNHIKSQIQQTFDVKCQNLTELNLYMLLMLYVMRFERIKFERYKYLSIKILSYLVGELFSIVMSLFASNIQNFY